MNNLIKHFGNFALDGFKKNLDNFSKSINSLDFDDFDKVIKEAEKKMSKKLEKLRSFVTQDESAFILNIPYDRDLDVIEARIETDNKFSVKVTTLDSTKVNEVSVYIPEEYNIINCKNKYDSEKHIMYYIFEKMGD